MNKTIFYVTEDYENFRFNRAIARIREFTNLVFDSEKRLKEKKELFKFILENIIKLINPMTPHLAEEAWQFLGNKKYLVNTNWPTVNKMFQEKEAIVIAVQINGKLKGTIEISEGMKDEEIEKKAFSLPKVIKIMENNKPKKVIVIKNKVVNIVI